MGGAALSGSARAWFWAVLAGGCVWVLGAAALARPTALTPRMTLGLALVVALCTWSQVRSFPIVWQGRRIAIHPDEATLMVAMLVLPAPELMLAATLATLVGQLWLRRPIPKLAFNVAAQTIATACGVVAFLAARELGLSPLGAAALVPFVVSAVNQVVVAILLAFLGDEPVLAAFGTETWIGAGVAGGGGALLGLLVVALYHLHPIALVVVPLLAWSGIRAMSAYYWHQNEAAAREHLTRGARDILAAREESHVTDSILQACSRSFGSATIRFEEEATSEDAGHAQTLVAPVVSEGHPHARLVLGLSRTQALERASHQTTLELAATYLSLGLANVRTLRSLERAERRLRDVFSATPDPVLLVGPDGSEIFANAAAKPGGVRVLDALSRPSREALRASLSAPKTETVELRSSDDDALRVWDAVATPMPLEDEPHARLLLLRDVTHRHLLQLGRDHQRTQLEQAERLASLGTLVAGIAHEVNNPLMYVDGGLEIALMDLQEAAAEPSASAERIRGAVERLEETRAGTRRIAAITRALSVVASAAGQRESRPFELATLVERLAADAQARSRARICAEPSAPIVGLGSPAAIERALRCLVDNAIDATPQGGRITLRIDSSVDQVCVSVEDDGPGMSEDIQRRLFAPFFTTKHDGVGLGLATALALVRAHRGSIEVRSAQGKGTRVELRLPLLQGADTVAAPGAGRHETPS